VECTAPPERTALPPLGLLLPAGRAGAEQGPGVAHRPGPVPASLVLGTLSAPCRHPVGRSGMTPGALSAVGPVKPRVSGARRRATLGWRGVLARCGGAGCRRVQAWALPPPFPPPGRMPVGPCSPRRQRTQNRFLASTRLTAGAPPIQYRRSRPSVLRSAFRAVF